MWLKPGPCGWQEIGTHRRIETSLSTHVLPPPKRERHGRHGRHRWACRIFRAFHALRDSKPLQLAPEGCQFASRFDLTGTSIGNVIATDHHVVTGNSSKHKPTVVILMICLSFRFLKHGRHGGYSVTFRLFRAFRHSLIPFEFSPDNGEFAVWLHSGYDVSHVRRQVKKRDGAAKVIHNQGGIRPGMDRHAGGTGACGHGSDQRPVRHIDDRNRTISHVAHQRGVRLWMDCAAHGPLHQRQWYSPPLPRSDRQPKRYYRLSWARLPCW